MFINGEVFAEMLRVLHCSKIEDFKKIFGDDARYLWSKFIDTYKGNTSDFICYLDGENVEKLFQYLAPTAVRSIYGKTR